MFQNEHLNNLAHPVKNSKHDSKVCPPNILGASVPFKWYITQPSSLLKVAKRLPTPPKNILVVQI